MGTLATFRPKGHIVVHIQVGEQSVSLEHRVDLPLIGWQIVDNLSVKDYLAGGWGEKPADDPQGCGFAAAGGPSSVRNFMVVEVKIDAVENTLPVELPWSDPGAE